VTRTAALAAGAVALAVGALALGAITRGPGFHVYADQRTWLGVPHAGDVLGNLPFVVGGAWSRGAAARGRRSHGSRRGC
jgi:hypothetical protein